MSEAPAEIESISTGALTLDLALGIGGLPKGRITEMFGPESSGKTTLALSVVAEAQKLGGQCLYVDMEQALDPVYARAIGVDVDNLLLAQPDYAEMALSIADDLIKTGEIAVVVVDSVAALVPRAEIDGEFGDAHMGLQARLMGQAMRKMTPAIAQTDTIVIFINQLREKIGIVFGNPETTPGGRALKFYASVRLDIRRSEAIKEGKETTGNRTKVKVVKNKCAAPFQEAFFDIGFGEGIDKTGCLLDAAVKREIITQAGSWYAYDGKNIGQGKDGAKYFLTNYPDKATEIHTKVLASV